MDDDMRGEFFVPGVLPGLNEIIRAAKSHPQAYAKMKKQWTDDIYYIIKSAKLPPMDKAYLKFTWYEKNRRRDPDNIAAGGRKLILDSLVMAKVLDNDGWAQVLGWEDKFVVDKPGVHVQIRGTMK